MSTKPKYCGSCRYKENMTVKGIATYVTVIHGGQTCDKCGWYKPEPIERY